MRKELASVRTDLRKQWSCGRDGDESRTGCDGREEKGSGVRWISDDITIGKDVFMFIYFQCVRRLISCDG